MGPSSSYRVLTLNMNTQLPLFWSTLSFAQGLDSKSCAGLPELGVFQPWAIDNSLSIAIAWYLFHKLWNWKFTLLLNLLFQINLNTRQLLAQPVASFWVLISCFQYFVISSSSLRFVWQNHSRTFPVLIFKQAVQSLPIHETIPWLELISREFEMGPLSVSYTVLLTGVPVFRG